MLKGTLSSDITNDLILDQPSSFDTAEIPADVSKETPQAPQLPPPPQGDEKKAEKYIQQLIKLIDQDKLVIHRTDLRRFEIPHLQDHYFINLGDYEVEISHSKQADTGKDFYVLLFNNIKKIEEGCTNKVILAYSPLNAELFQRFKKAVFAHLDRRRQAMENRKFQEAVKPIDKVLDHIGLQPIGQAFKSLEEDA